MADLIHPAKKVIISNKNKKYVQTQDATMEPFNAGRETARLLFDFSAMISLTNHAVIEHHFLDFGAGTGWISEFCVRMGIKTVAFDIHGNLKALLSNRIAADERIDPMLLSYAHGDGHHMPFNPEVFGHILCYDTLHHMHDYENVFYEFFRVLKKGGRSIFVEPGARHSSSDETIAFVKEQKKMDPNWIERDVVLEEIDEIAKKVGAKCQDIDYPSLTVNNAKTSITLVINLAYFYLAQHKRKIILGENGPLKMLVGAQDDFLRLQCQGFIGKR
jgi:SAM-dependent methyltransferase